MPNPLQKLTNTAMRALIGTPSLDDKALVEREEWVMVEAEKEGGGGKGQEAEKKEIEKQIKKKVRVVETEEEAAWANEMR